MKPLVSIVIPIYNVEKYVERALRSVLAQTYTNIEAILVDDCGTDNSMQIVEEFVNTNDKDGIFKIVHHTHNRGLSAARNTGMDNAKGDYIYFLDSDDEIPSDCIVHLYALIEKYNKVDMVIGNVINISTHNDHINKRLRYDFSSFPEYSNDQDWIVRNIFCGDNGSFVPSVSTNKLLSMDFIVKNNLRFMEGIIHEDEKFLFDYAECIKSIAFCSYATYLRYINPGSITQTITSSKSISAWITIIRCAYPRFKAPYILLKFAYCISCIVSIYLQLHKNSYKDIVKSKWFIFNLMISIYLKGFCKLANKCWLILILPFRFTRLTKEKRFLNSYYSICNLK